VRQEIAKPGYRTHVFARGEGRCEPIIFTYEDGGDSCMGQVFSPAQLNIVVAIAGVDRNIQLLNQA
jgi:hypothetical protein